MGAGVGAGLAYGGMKGIKAWDNRVQDSILDRMTTHAAETQARLATGAMSPEKAANRMARLERATMSAYDNSRAAKVARGMEKAAGKVKHWKVPGGIIGGAAMLGGILGAANSD